MPIDDGATKQLRSEISTLRQRAEKQGATGGRAAARAAHVAAVTTRKHQKRLDAAGKVFAESEPQRTVLSAEQIATRRVLARLDDERDEQPDPESAQWYGI